MLLLELFLFCLHVSRICRFRLFRIQAMLHVVALLLMCMFSFLFLYQIFHHNNILVNVLIGLLQLFLHRLLQMFHYLSLVGNLLNRFLVLLFLLFHGLLVLLLHVVLLHMLRLFLLLLLMCILFFLPCSSQKILVLNFQNSLQLVKYLLILLLDLLR